jgi:hypothetical protein
MIALVGVSISGMPGPPLGPSNRMTITAPCAPAADELCSACSRRWGF